MAQNTRSDIWTEGKCSKRLNKRPDKKDYWGIDK